MSRLDGAFGPTAARGGVTQLTEGAQRELRPEGPRSYSGSEKTELLTRFRILAEQRERKGTESSDDSRNDIYTHNLRLRAP